MSVQFYLYYTFNFPFQFRGSKIGDIVNPSNLNLIFSTFFFLFPFFKIILCKFSHSLRPNERMKNEKKKKQETKISYAQLRTEQVIKATVAV